MTCYRGRHAELYDLFYREKTYAHEASFLNARIRELAVGSARSVLELACGTGEHAFALEALGYQVTAIDFSPDMLAQARAKMDARHSSVRFVQQDMRALDVPERPFDVAVCLFDSIGYVVTNAALRSTLSGVARHLRPGGLFLFDFWHAPAMLCLSDPLRMRRWKTASGEVLRIAETTLAPAEQTARILYRVYEHHTNGTYTSFEEEQTNRYFLVPDMEGWLEAAGFEVLRWSTAYSDEPITRETFHVLGVARRRVPPESGA